MAKIDNKILFKILSSKIMSRDVSALLSKFFRIIVQETGMINNMEGFIDKYVDASKTSGKEKTKPQVVAAIASEQMSWKTFMDSICNLLRVKKITIVIKLDHGNNKVTIHELPIKATVDDSIIEQKQEEKKNE